MSQFFLPSPVGVDHTFLPLQVAPRWRQNEVKGPALSFATPRTLWQLPPELQASEWLVNMIIMVYDKERTEERNVRLEDFLIGL